MSRRLNLLKEASRKAAPDIRRIYFDTEFLSFAGWPLISNRARDCLDLAVLMGIELCVPEPALHERRAQWLRARQSEIDQIRDKARSVERHLRLIGLTVNIGPPSAEQMCSKYEDAEQKTLARLNVRSVTYGERALQEVFQLAIGRQFTFEDGADGVVGFQDSVILISALDHLRASPISAAFVPAREAATGELLPLTCQ